MLYVGTAEEMVIGQQIAMHPRLTSAVRTKINLGTIRIIVAHNSHRITIRDAQVLVPITIIIGHSSFPETRNQKQLEFA